MLKKLTIKNAKFQINKFSNIFGSLLSELDLINIENDVLWSNETFKHLKKLQKLSLSHTTTFGAMINKNVFSKDLQNVASLNLTYCNINELNDDTFENLK